MMMAVPENKDKLAYIGGIESARFRRPVVPGDTLIMEARMVKMKGPIGKARMMAHVENELAAECEMTFAFKECRTPDQDQVYAKIERLQRSQESEGGNGDLD